MTNTKPIFPDEIHLEIFSRMPAKSIGKFKCFSTTLQTELSTDHFSNLHLTNFNHQEKLLSIDNDSGSLLEVNLREKTMKEMNLGNRKWNSVLGSCNGLVLLQENKTDNVFVSNPVTRKLVRIPTSGSNSGSAVMYGLGYDSSCEDYKVVKLNEYLECVDESGRRCFFEVYSLKTRVWRKVFNGKGSFDDHYMAMSYCNMPFVNGALHWTVIDHEKKYHVYAFNLSTETFCEVPVPDIESGYGFNCMVLDGCLSFENCCAQFRDVWMMKEYGVADSWKRFCFKSNKLESLVIPVCFVGEGELLSISVRDRKRWVLCNMEREKVRQIDAGDFPFLLRVIRVVVYSLRVSSLLNKRPPLLSKRLQSDSKY